jgi:hypothetical protein
MLGKPRERINKEQILSRVSEADILAFYLGISKIPCIINSPLRKDNKPSFGLYSWDGKSISYTDFATDEKGTTFDLLSQLFGLDYNDTLLKINNDLFDKKNVNIKKYIKKIKSVGKKSDTQLKCKIREWRQYDIDYWNSFGISKAWLEYAEVYPISHKIIYKEKDKYVFAADKYAYVFVERKEGNITLKIYQPYNTQGFKWCNKNDSSVLGLWTKVPEYGEQICICSSLKDSLCLWSNCNIPAIYVQGEGYTISNTAMKELKKRYKNIYILFDNDNAGLKDGEKLSKLTGFTNIVLPRINNCKDISDLYKYLSNKEQFRKIIKPLFNL